MVRAAIRPAVRSPYRANTAPPSTAAKQAPSGRAVSRRALRSRVGLERAQGEPVTDRDSEDHIDCEAHERGVHRPGRPDQHALTTVQLTATEQPTATAREAVSEVAALADGLALGAEEDDRFQGFPPFI